MLYAKVVLGLPIEGPFDYRVTEVDQNLISVGSRVWVNFRGKKEVAYVVGLSARTSIKKIKDIISVIDRSPILDNNMILLAEKISRYYCCSLGEALETALPDELRKGRRLEK